MIEIGVLGWHQERMNLIKAFSHARPIEGHASGRHNIGVALVFLFCFFIIYLVVSVRWRRVM